MCIPSFNTLALKVPEKTSTRIFNVNLLFGERKQKWMKIRKNKSHDPESQSNNTITHSTYVYHI